MISLFTSNKHLCGFCK